MIGARFIDADGNPHQVVGQDGGYWLISRTDAHAPVERITAADLAANFTSGAGAGAPVDEPAQPSSDDGWRALGESSRRAAEALARGAVGTAPDTPTPEDRLAAASNPSDVLTERETVGRLGHKP